MVPRMPPQEARLGFVYSAPYRIQGISVAGEQAVIRYGNRVPPYRETMDYVPKVLRSYERDRNGLAPVEAFHVRRPASPPTISYRHVASSTAGAVSYQHAASSRTVSHPRTTTAVKKNAARSRPAVVYLSNSP